jgi:heat-inducible transcriptional repressor
LATLTNPLQALPGALAALDERSREIFKRIVEAYLATGEPVGSRNLSRLLPMTLSPASVRNVMADLEATGLIYSPHLSAGRLPTEIGMRFFVDALLEIGDLSSEDRARIDAEVRASAEDRSLDAVLRDASSLLSGLSRGAGVVVTTKSTARLKHVEFVALEPRRALLVLVSDDGSVENRVVALPPGLPASALTEATNFLNARVLGKTLPELRAELAASRDIIEREIDALTADLIEAGLANWSGDAESRQLIVRGQANLLENLKAAEDLERVRLLLADLETQREVADLLARAEEGEGVRIFIGSENKLFSLSGSTMIAAPLKIDHGKIVGVLGVIGPTRLNYARVIPMVDYTAKVVSTLISRGAR